MESIKGFEGFKDVCSKTRFVNDVVFKFPLLIQNHLNAEKKLPIAQSLLKRLSQTFVGVRLKIISMIRDCNLPKKIFYR